jgi:hypothetical protein
MVGVDLYTFCVAVKKFESKMTAVLKLRFLYRFKGTTQIARNLGDNFNPAS